MNVFVFSAHVVRTLSILVFFSKTQLSDPFFRGVIFLVWISYFLFSQDRLPQPYRALKHCVYCAWGLLHLMSISIICYLMYSRLVHHTVHMYIIMDLYMNIFILCTWDGGSVDAWCVGARVECPNVR